MREHLERHQLVVYLLGLGLGVTCGLLAPALAQPLGHAVTPLLALLLYATFVALPLDRRPDQVVGCRFLLALLGLNFLVVPVVVASLLYLGDHVGAGAGGGLSDPVRLGVLLVLLTPCIDYVVVFTGVVGGDREQLLACTPLLLGLQALLLPAYLAVLGPRDGAQGLVAPGPFLTALLTVLVAPLLAALMTRRAGRRADRRADRRAVLPRVGALAEASMVPVLAAVLATVAASQMPRVADRWTEVLAAVPFFLGFAAAMVPLGVVLSRAAGVTGSAGRAVMMSGLTRNSLVVLPLALALPPSADLTAAVVVTQTMVEIVVLLLVVRLLPRVRRGEEAASDHRRV